MIATAFVNSTHDTIRQYSEKPIFAREESEERQERGGARRLVECSSRRAERASASAIFINNHTKIDLSSTS
jgi:hypothetical protein